MDIKYTVLSQAKFASSLPIRRDTLMRLKHISDKTGVSVYRLADALLEACATRYEAGAIKIERGTIPRAGARVPDYDAEDYDAPEVKKAFAEVEAFKNTRESKYARRGPIEREIKKAKAVEEAFKARQAKLRAIDEEAGYAKKTEKPEKTEEESAEEKSGETDSFSDE